MATQHTNKEAKVNVTHFTSRSAAQPYNRHPSLENGNLRGGSAAQPGHPLLENGNCNIYIQNLYINCSAAQRSNGHPLRIEKVHDHNGHPLRIEKVHDHTRPNVEKMKQEKEREVTEYKAWLKKNITRLTDSWTSNKTGWKGATNSKLDLAEKERLFRNHVNELHKQYRREYSQLLKEVITQDLEIKYLELWSCAKSLMVRRERFRLLPEPEMEGEWRRHVEQISKKKGTSREKGKQQ